MAPEQHQPIHDRPSRTSQLERVEKLFRDMHMSDREIPGSLIAQGAKITNFALTGNMESWRPVVIQQSDPPRAMVMFNPLSTPLWGAETLIFGVLHSTEIEPSVSLDTQTLFMVPYLRFNEDNTVNAQKSHILILSKRQADDLCDLFREYILS